MSTWARASSLLTFVKVYAYYRHMRRNVRYRTCSGHRQVEVISLDGQPTFRVSDAYGYLAGLVSSQAYVPIRTETCGVELADLDI